MYEDWMDEDSGSCPLCGEKWELVRPGKSQPVCECQDYCSEHGVKFEHRVPPANHKGGGIFGEVCPICYPVERSDDDV